MMIMINIITYSQYIKIYRTLCFNKSTKNENEFSLPAFIT